MTASQEEQGEAGPDSVFDFLYHDSRRIGSFLSQFDNNGLLTAINQGESASRNARRGWSVELGGEVPLLAEAWLHALPNTVYPDGVERERIVVHAGAFVSIHQPDGSFRVSRLD